MSIIYLIGQMSGEEFSRLENFINQQLSAGKVMPESQAKQQAQTGDLIYVNSYTRADGTEVKVLSQQTKILDSYNGWELFPSIS